MSVSPTVYFSSKKENPKTNIQFTIKDINEIINIDLDSYMELPLVLNETKYILKLNLQFNLNDKEAITNVNYDFIEQEECLLTFINEMKNKIENIIEEENKKVEELESIIKLKNERLKEVMELEENINKIKLEKDLLLKEKLKQEEDFKIYKHNQQVKYYTEQNVLLKELVNKVIKLEEEIKLSNSFYVEDDEQHNKTMEEIKAKNYKIQRENEKLKEELNETDLTNTDLKVELNETDTELKEKLNETDLTNTDLKVELNETDTELKEKLNETDLKKDELINTDHHKEDEQEKTVPFEFESKKFDQGKIISYLKNELENINKDEKDLDTLNDEKINKLKEKYEQIPTFIPKEIINDPNNESLKLEEEIYDHLKLIISDDLNMIYTNLIYVITELMKFVETFNMEGFDKKQFIIDSIKKFLIYQKMDSHETDFILDTICPELIDILLLVDKRKIIIGKKLNCFIPWCA